MDTLRPQVGAGNGVNKHPIDPAYRRGTGLWNLHTDNLPLPNDFDVKERNLVYIPPGDFGGNHKHPRREIFVGVGDDLYLLWQDEVGRTHEDKMMDGGQLYLFEVSPLTPHAVVNRGAGFALLFELADGPANDVQPADVLAHATR